MSVRAAIKAQDHAVKQSPAFKRLKHFKANTPAQAMNLIPDFRALDKKLDLAATVVSKATASTAKEKVGQRDWVAGVRGLVRGISQLVVGLKDVEHGNKSAAKAEALIAQKTLNQANALGVKGDRALGLPTSD